MMQQDREPKRGRGRPRLARDEQSAATVQALDRGLKLLRVLSEEGAAILTDIALQVGMPPSTAHRLLSTLQKQGFVELDSTTQEWSIGIEAFRVGSAYLERTNLVESARAIMRELTASTGETANLAVGNRGDVVFISQVESPNPIRAFFQPGTRGPMHASGIGKVLLASYARAETEKILHRKGCAKLTEKTLSTPSDLFADLDRITERGWSFDDEESHLGMRCVAAAIYNEFAEVVAGVSVSGPSLRLDDGSIAGIGVQVRSAAERITRAIGGRLPADRH